IPANMTSFLKFSSLLFLASFAFTASGLAQQKKSGSKATPQKKSTPAPAASPSALPDAKRIVFLGDSITWAGQYIEYLETILLAETDKRYEMLDLGLSSETVSGLSEPNHANGQFPRPYLHERLERVLDKTKPDLVL